MIVVLRSVSWALLCCVTACGSSFVAGSNGGASGATAEGPGAGDGGASGDDGSGSESGDSGDAGANQGDAGQSSVGQAGVSAGGGANGGDTGAGGSSGTGASAGAGVGGATTHVPKACQTLADCEAGQNCLGQLCTPALASCAAVKAMSPAAKDGIYWIAPAAKAQRAYCDMALGTELCTEVAGEHNGRTRDKAAIPYTMSSLLMPAQGVCKIWALRGTNDGIPFQSLAAYGSVPQGYTCIYLGFVLDGKLGGCLYGSTKTNCGFTIAAFYRYSNECTGCDVGAGSFDRWTKQGPISNGAVLSSTSGGAFTTCKTN